MSTHRPYVPAAGYHALLPFYDPLLALLTRETKWRQNILETLSLAPGDVLVDVGCGTGTLSIMAKTKVPGARVIGVDPDPGALKRARKKAERRGVAVEFNEGFGSDTAKIVTDCKATKIVSSFAFHHMSDEAQSETLAAMKSAMAPNALLRIADFVSGHMAESTDSAKLLNRVAASGLVDVSEVGGFKTLFGAVVIVGGRKPG